MELYGELVKAGVEGASKTYAVVEQEYWNSLVTIYVTCDLDKRASFCSVAILEYTSGISNAFNNTISLQAKANSQLKLIKSQMRYLEAEAEYNCYGRSVWKKARCWRTVLPVLQRLHVLA